MPKKNLINKYSCLLVKESANAEYFAEDCTIRTAEDAAEVARKLTQIHHSPSEQLWIIMLNTKLQITGYAMVSAGGLTNATADSRDVFRTAILNNAHALILTHNHPSGDVKPSNQDKITTKKLVDAGSIIGIEIIDHVILGNNDDFTSMREQDSSLF